MSELRHKRNNLWQRFSRADLIPVGAAALVRTYTAPVGSPVSTRYTVSADGSQTCCYEIEPDLHSERGHFANFETDSTAPVLVTITSTFLINTAKVRPVSRGITPAFTPGTNTLSFYASKADNYVVVLNEDWLNPLYIFANPYEEIPNPNDFTYYYGPGYYNNVVASQGTGGSNYGATLPSFWGALQVNSNQSVYVHGGAYVKGKIFMGPATANAGPTAPNINVSGYGVIDSMNSPATMGPGRPGQVGSVNGGSLKGITMIGKIHWGCTIAESADINLFHVKMLNYKDGMGSGSPVGGTPDGIDIIGSRRVTYDHCFINAGDDTIAIKTWKSGFGPSPFWRGNVEDITVIDCVFSGGRGGNGWDIGNELFNNGTDGVTPIIDPTTGAQIDHVSGITYKRCDFVRKIFPSNINYRCAPIGIHAADDTLVTNVLYEDINIDETVDTDAWIWIGSGSWDTYTYGQRGPITNITFRRVNFRDGNPSPDEIHLEGGSSTQRISNVVFEDMYIKGSKVISNANSSGKWTWNVTNTDALTFV